MRDLKHRTAIAAPVVLLALLLSPCPPPAAAAAAPPVNETMRLVDEIDSINTRLAEIDRDYGALIASLSEFDSQAEKANALHRKATKDLEARRENLNSRLVSMYKSGSADWFTGLLHSRNLLDLLNRADLAWRVARVDAGALRSVRAAEEKVRAQEHSIIEKRRTLRSKCSRAIQQQSSLRGQLDACMKKLASADPVLARVMAQPQTELSRKINAYFARRRSPLAGYGIVFAQAGKRTGVSARLLVGLTAAESSCATAGTYSRTNHNAWGMKGPQPRIAGGIPAKYGFCNWPNWEVAIQQAADFVLHYWGPAQTARQLKGYCETGGPGSDWERRVETVRNAI